jgi:signal transduction histidine kinase
VIKGAVETIQDNPEDLNARTRFLGAIGSETDRLIRLVNDLLVLTRADAGALQLQRAPTDIGVYVQTRITLFQPLAQRANIELAVESAVPGLCASIDTHRLAQVLDNLLDNALRHTPAAGRILVRVSADDSIVRCEVSDSGRGIEAQHLARVFDRFYRADASRARHSGGSGLGLSIAQALVTAQGGQMRVSSVPGQGSVFEFSLPRVSCLQTDTH